MFLGDSDVNLGNADALIVFMTGVVSFSIRYWRIAFPNRVVFDEVYFGNFSNYYITSRFYHDIHPPFAKILMFVMANLSEYDGSINFGNCPKAGYPLQDYVHLRITPATCSALCYPVIYITMRFMKYSITGSLCAAVLAMFDTSMAAEGRHILTDGILHFFTCLHVAVLSYTLTIRRRRARFWVWHILTGLTLGIACSCKNTAWGLTALDGFAYVVALWDVHVLGWLDYLFEVGVFGTTLLLMTIGVYFVIFSIHFVLLPYDGPGTPYLRPDMKEQLIHGDVGSGLFGMRLKGFGLFTRAYYLTKRMHSGNMGIQKFHVSQSFPKHWPWLGNVMPYFWGGSNAEIRCWGNAFSYGAALFGIIACTALGLKRMSVLSNNIRIVVGYAVSYFPFFLIPRVMFLYHYIIPLIFGCMAFGAFLDVTVRPKYRGLISCTVCCLAMFGYWLWAPYVYGTPRRDKEVTIWTKRWIDGDAEHQRLRAAG